MNFEDFQQDPKTVAAVERKLQIISEAAIRLGEEAERLCPGPQWRNIRGLGNWLRHQYDRIDLERIWRRNHRFTVAAAGRGKRHLAAPGVSRRRRARGRNLIREHKRHASAERRPGATLESAAVPSFR